MKHKQTYIIKNFPGGYGEGIANPQIIATLGIGTYALRLDEKWNSVCWFEVSHGNMIRHNNWQDDATCLAWKKLVAHLNKLGVYDVYGWRGYLTGHAAQMLLNHCIGCDQDDFREARRNDVKDVILDFNDFREA